jgi:nitroreductase
MDFSQLIKKRYSSRHYSSDPVPENLLNQVLEAARLAPTAANKQPFKLLVIPTSTYKSQLKNIYPKDWFVQAPYVICACALPDQGWVRHRFDSQNYSTVDVSIVVDHITLQAADLGLATCWVGAFDPQAARDQLDLPETLIPIAFTPLGYPLDSAAEKERKPLSDLVEFF